MNFTHSLWIQDDMNREWVSLMLHSGLLTRQVGNLQKSDIDLSRRSIHTLSKHTYGALLLNVGMPVFALQSLLGHRYLETTLNYARLCDETVAKQFLETRAPTCSYTASWCSNADTGSQV